MREIDNDLMCTFVDKSCLTIFEQTNLIEECYLAEYI